MQRSDITNINKLFLESTSTYYVYVAELSYPYRMYASDALQADNLESAMVKIALPLREEIINMWLRENKMYLLRTKPEIKNKASKITGLHDKLIIISAEAISDYDKHDKHYIPDLYSDACNGSNFTLLQSSKTLAPHVYKQSALHGSNDEAGLGDILDTL